MVGDKVAGVSAQTQGPRLTAALHHVAPKVTLDADLELAWGIGKGSHKGGCHGASAPGPWASIQSCDLICLQRGLGRAGSLCTQEDTESFRGGRAGSATLLEFTAIVLETQSCPFRGSWFHRFGLCPTLCGHRHSASRITPFLLSTSLESRNIHDWSLVLKDKELGLYFFSLTLLPGLKFLETPQVWDDKQPQQ